jgi:hypothetical protein
VASGEAPVHGVQTSQAERRTVAPEANTEQKKKINEFYQGLIERSKQNREPL